MAHSCHEGLVSLLNPDKTEAFLNLFAEKSRLLREFRDSLLEGRLGKYADGANTKLRRPLDQLCHDTSHS